MKNLLDKADGALLKQLNNKNCWYDFTSIALNLDNVIIEDYFRYLRSTGIYDGCIVTLDFIKFNNIYCDIPFFLVVKIKSLSDLDKLTDFFSINKNLTYNLNVIVLSCFPEILQVAKNNFMVAFRYEIVDKNSLLKCIEDATNYDYIILKFLDPTNIPLEQVIASLQKFETRIIKEINYEKYDDDTLSTLGVMEKGADGILFTPAETSEILKFSEVFRTNYRLNNKVLLEECTVIKTEYVGLGHRACVDLVTLFNSNEGLLIGSTSQGGILCCPEVFYMPYMELRPFRVNAGGVHSYIFHFDESTSYLTELKAGSKVSIVSFDGNVRQSVVGRIKIEVRPLRLIQVEFASKEIANIILQDDWHVRVFSHEGTPRNLNEIRVGDKLLGMKSQPGRHIGIKIEETIMEV